MIEVILIVQFIAILLTALAMGIHFGTWLTEDPIRKTNSASMFIEIHQGRDRVVARVMPILGSLALVFVAIGVFFMRYNLLAFTFSIIGLLFLISDMLVTIGINVPINIKVQSWQSITPPADWALLRDRWEKFHSIRSLFAVLGFAFFVAGVLFFKN